MKNIKIWSDEEIDYLIDNYKNKTYNELASYFNCHSHVVRSKMLKMKLNKNVKRRNLDFLLADNLESFYWIGFILADGCFVKERNLSTSSKLSLIASEKDELHILKLAKKLNANIRKRIISDSFSTKPVVEFSVSDLRKIPQICEKFDIKSRKTYNPPDFSKYNFTDDQMLSLIIGFIDGDGSITTKNDRIIMSIFVHESWENNMKFINSFIHKKFRSIKENSISYNRKNQVGFQIGKKKILKNMKFFIEQYNLPVLDRKWKNIKSLNYNHVLTTKSNRSTEGIITKKKIIIENIEFSSISEACRYFECSRDLITSYRHKIPTQGEYQ